MLLIIRFLFIYLFIHQSFFLYEILCHISNVINIFYRDDRYSNLKVFEIRNSSSIIILKQYFKTIDVKI